jgi:hypothetical protein
MREYDRAVLKSKIASMFWSVIQDRKSAAKFTLQSVADRMGVDKSRLSRWFSGGEPNWQLNTVSDLANALDLAVEIRAMDRRTGAIYGPAGRVPYSTSTSTSAGNNTAKLCSTSGVSTFHLTSSAVESGDKVRVEAT